MTFTNGAILFTFRRYQRTVIVIIHGFPCKKYILVATRNRRKPQTTPEFFYSKSQTRRKQRLMLSSDCFPLNAISKTKSLTLELNVFEVCSLYTENGDQSSFHNILNTCEAVAVKMNLISPRTTRQSHLLF